MDDYRVRQVELDSDGEVIPDVGVLYFAILESGAKLRYDWSWKQIDLRLHSAEAKFSPDYPSLCTGREIIVSASQDWYRKNTKLREWLEHRHKLMRLLLMGLVCHDCGQPIVDPNFTPDDICLRKCDACDDRDTQARIRKSRKNDTEGEEWKDA